MFALISGKPRVGKTSLIACFAFSRMLGNDVRERIMLHKRETKLFNKQTGHNFTYASDHLFFSDFDFYARREYMRSVKSHDIDGFWIGLPNPYIRTALFPACSTICLIEAEKYYDSRRTSSYPLPPWVYRFYERHGHMHYDIFFDCHRPIQIDKGIRSLADTFIFPREKKDYYDKYGCLIRSTWDCMEFSSIESAEKFSDTEVMTADGKKTQYIFHGDIHSCYNSHGYAESFLNVPIGSDYTFTKNRKAKDYKLVSSIGAPFEPDYVVPDVFMQKKWEKCNVDWEKSIEKWGIKK